MRVRGVRLRGGAYIIDARIQQTAAVTQFRTGLLLEVVFGVRAIIAGCDATFGNVTTVCRRL